MLTTSKVIITETYNKGSKSPFKSTVSSPEITYTSVYSSQSPFYYKN